MLKSQIQLIRDSRIFTGNGFVFPRKIGLIFYLLHTSIIQSATQYQVYIITLRLTWIL